MGATNGFEAKVYADVVALIDNQACCMGGGSAEYFDWLFEITDGGTKAPVWEDMKADFYTLLEKMIEEKPSYDYTIDRNLEAHTMFKPLKECYE